MSVQLLTTTQYDATKYTPVGSVLLNQVEAISMLRSAFAGFGAMFGGKNTLIQEAVDRLQARGLTAFSEKVKNTYPNTVTVIGLETNISEVGRDDQQTYMVMTVTGTCLVPLGQTGGASTGHASAPRRRTLKASRRS
jgi:uncharacterized protein YbjQ (UPF0145 family)